MLLVRYMHLQWLAKLYDYYRNNKNNNDLAFFNKITTSIKNIFIVFKKLHFVY